MMKNKFEEDGKVGEDMLPLKPDKKDYVVGRFVAMTADSKLSPFPTIIFGRIDTVGEDGVELTLYTTRREPTEEIEDHVKEPKDVVTDFYGIIDRPTTDKFHIDIKTGYANLSRCKDKPETMHQNSAQARLVVGIDDPVPSRIPLSYYEDLVKEAQEIMVEAARCEDEEIPEGVSFDGSNWDTLVKCSRLSDDVIKGLY